MASFSLDITSLIECIDAQDMLSQNTAFCSDTKVRAWHQEIIQSLNIELERYKYTIILQAYPWYSPGEFKPQREMVT